MVRKMTIKSRTETRYQSLGKHLRHIRLEAGIKTQRELLDNLAEQGIGCFDESFWSKVETGKRRPSRENLIALLKFFHEKNGCLTPEDAQIVLDEAGYKKLSEGELRFIFGTKSPSTTDTKPPKTAFGSALAPQNFEYIQVLFWGVYLFVLEFWRNLVWDFLNVADVNWKGLILPVLLCGLIFLSFGFIKPLFWRATFVLFMSILSGITLITLFHQPGIIAPVLNSLGGIVTAILIFSRGPSWILPNIDLVNRKVINFKNRDEHQMAISIMQVSVLGISLVVLIGIAMNLILFMAPPEAFNSMPHHLRVARGIEILLAIIMILVQLGIWWLLPLLRFLSHPISET